MWFVEVLGILLGGIGALAGWTHRRNKAYEQPRRGKKKGKR